MRSRLAFLTRLVFLKLAAFLVFVALALYAPSLTNLLLDRAGAVAALLARGVDELMQYVGGGFGAAGAAVPRRGAVELTFRFVAMDKVMLFIGITVALYLGWILLIALMQALSRSLRRPTRLAPADPPDVLAPHGAASPSSAPSAGTASATMRNDRG